MRLQVSRGWWKEMIWLYKVTIITFILLMIVKMLRWRIEDNEEKRSRNRHNANVKEDVGGAK